MRLLERNSSGEFSLTEDIIDDNAIPPYAILSHTWNEGEEVIFKELIAGTGKSKPGYEKIRFCGEQAKRDGLQYFWVDTCCIDKSNNTELSEAINSMFRWYREATRCYVYLSDVSSPAFDNLTNDPLSVLPFESVFRASRWFTRGWTLQELLAPSSVEFFSREGNRLGDKWSLQQIIHEITRIPVQALQEEASLSRFDVDERLSWAQNRKTTRNEDQAYSLLGLFDIYMPLIYGEGRENAWKRLMKKISKPLKGPDRLPYAAGAAFNSSANQHSPTCLPDTRVDLLQEIYGWANGNHEYCIFWLNGLAGTGKSTISRTVAHKWYKEGRLGASFFFSRGGGDVGHAGKFVTSIAVQLAGSIPCIYPFICDAITEHSDIANRSLREQWQLLILDPLSKLDGKGCCASYVLVVDALDECDDDNNIRMILQLLAEARSLEKVRLHVFLTSRPDIPIRYGFNQMPHIKHQDFVLHNISPSIVDHDIAVFLEYNLRLIRQERSLDAAWPGEEIIGYLVQIASGLFIWAATACRFVREGKRFAPKRLNTILNGSEGGAVTAPEKHLNEIYMTVLKDSVSPEYTDEEKEELYYMLRQTVGSIAILFSPLSRCSLSKLLCVTREDIDQTLEDLHSVLDVPKDQACPLRLHHPSFRDFLLNNNRCKDPNFWVDEKQAHQTLADRCIKLMSTSLKQDICGCGLDAPGMLVTDVARSRVEKYLPPAIQYACLYWTQHLQKCDAQIDQIHHFLQVHLLHWLEALGWMKKTSEGILAILSLEALIPTGKDPKLQAFIYDAKRFVLYNRSVIEQAPLRLYTSALVFAPETSIVRRQFEECIPPWIQRKPRVQANWNAALQTLEGHSSSVTSVAFSPDCKQVVSGSLDKTLRLWDAVTGALLQTLKGHSDSVYSVAFSPDGKQVVSGSYDKTVRLWDAVTGAPLQTPLTGHSDYIYSVAFSPDSKQVVSGSLDKTVRLWDTVIGALLQTLKGHSDYVYSVAFSPDGKQIVSGSLDKTVRLWDAVTGALLQTLEGHSSCVSSVAFSPDSKQVVSGSLDKTVRIWDAVTGAPLQTLEGHLSSVYSVAFSPVGKQQVVSGSYDKTVRLWDTVVTGAPLQTLEGHSDSVTSVAFSYDGKQVVSGSYDKTVQLWDAITGMPLQIFEGHSDDVYSVAFSPNGKQIVSGSYDKTVRLWDTVTGALLQILEHSSSVNSVAFSPDGKQIVSGSYDKTVRLWDAVTGAPLQILKGHSNSINFVGFSPDGKQIVSGSYDKTVRLWDAVTGAPLQILKGHSNSVNFVGFSPDGKQVVSGSFDDTVRLWDATTGALLQTLDGNLSSVNSVAFSPDSKLENALFVLDNWVQDSKGKILWLPPNYRPTSIDVWNRTIVLGHSSGRISCLGFREDLL